jgi:hypothetical protein
MEPMEFPISVLLYGTIYTTFLETREFPIKSPPYVLTYTSLSLPSLSLSLSLSHIYILLIFSIF